MNKSEFVQKALNSVLEMHVLFGHPEGDGKHIITQDLLDLRSNLIIEEANETLESLELFDKENYAKELCDLLVVALGAFLCISKDLGSLTNQQFIDNTMKSMDEVNAYVGEHLQNIKFCVSDGKILNAIAMSMGLFLKQAEREELNLYENFFIVHDNNMSKSCLLEESAAEQVADYKMQGINCSYEFNPRSNRFIIKRKDSKILKPSSYKKAVVKLKEAV